MDLVEMKILCHGGAECGTRSPFQLFKFSKRVSKGFPSTPDRHQLTHLTTNFSTFLVAMKEWGRLRGAKAGAKFSFPWVSV